MKCLCILLIFPSEPYWNTKWASVCPRAVCLTPLDYKVEIYFFIFYWAFVFQINFIIQISQKIKTGVEHKHLFQQLILIGFFFFLISDSSK